MGIITEAAFTKTCHLPFESKTENENSRVHNGEVSMIRYRMFISWLLTSSTTLAPVIVNVSLNSNTGVRTFHFVPIAPVLAFSPHLNFRLTR